jgi:hypothetical protein
MGENCMPGFGLKTKKNHSEDIGLDGKVILKWISTVTTWCGGDTSMVQGRYHWLALINSVMNFRFPKMRGIS